MTTNERTLARVVEHVPAVIFQLQRTREGRESFPVITRNIGDLVPLTPSDLHTTSAPLWTLVVTSDIDRVRASLLHSETELTPWEIEFQVRLPGDVLRWIAAIGVPAREADGGISWHGLFLDATERRRAWQVEKMETVTRLAAGLAHDLNNLLTAILGNSDLALAELPVEHVARTYIEWTQQAAGRAAELTRQLLAFGRRQVLRLEIVRWNDIVTHAAVAEGLAAAGRADITLDLQLEGVASSVYADRGQLEQVLAKLVTNAADAMPPGGRLTIATGQQEIGEVEARRLPGMQAGPYAWLTVHDTGPGVEPALQAQIFEPFFTTKVTRSSTAGLGLSAVYGIIKQLDGYVRVESVMGSGTAFTVYLPLALETAPAPPTEPTATPVVGGTVLVAEDEASVREPVRRVLERFGYQVFDVANGEAALALVKSGRVPIDLLLTDVVMPGMSGSELARQVRELQPSIRILFMSGYSTEAIAKHGVLTPGSTFLQKPFSITELMHRVRETLESASS